MKNTFPRLGVAAAAALVGLLVPGNPSLAEDAKGRPCAELLLGSGSYRLGATPNTRVVDSVIELGAAPCGNITYTFQVNYTTVLGKAVTLSTSSYEVVGPSIRFVIDVADADAPDKVQGVITTAQHSRVIDEATGEISLDGLPGGGGGSYQG